jgi:hypothetical protein
MPATIDEGKVADLGGRLKNGQAELEGVLEALRGSAVAEIHVALQGTDTAQAFDEKVTELVTQLREALPAFEALAAFIDRFVQNFQESDAAQAAALRG